MAKKNFVFYLLIITLLLCGCQSKNYTEVIYPDKEGNIGEILIDEQVFYSGPELVLKTNGILNIADGIAINFQIDLFEEGWTFYEENLFVNQKFVNRNDNIEIIEDEIYFHVSEQELALNLIENNVSSISFDFCGVKGTSEGINPTYIRIPIEVILK